jgi:hypothetical protein
MRPVLVAKLICLFLVLLVTTATAQTSAQRARSSSVLRGTVAAESIQLPSASGQVAATLTPVSRERLKAIEHVVRNGSNVLEVPFVELLTPEQVLLALKLTVRVDPGLRCTRRGCTGIVRVGLNDSVRINERIQLPAPVPIQIFGPDMVDPDTFSITVTQFLRPIRIHSVAHSAVLNVSPAGYPAAEIPLPVQKVQLGMNAVSPTIDRFGLETTELHIGPIEGLDPGDTVVVRLEAKGARVDPSIVQVTSVNGATVKLRSRSGASGTVTAIGPSYVSTTPVNVTMIFPWFFLLFTMLGGLMGGFFRQTFFGSNGTTTQKATRVLASALMGVALTLLLVLGFNLLGIPLPVGDTSEPVGFAVGAVAAVIADAVAGVWRKTPMHESPAPREHQPA